MQKIETIVKGPVKVNVLRAVARCGLPEELSSYNYIQEIIIPENNGRACTVKYVGRHEGKRGFVRKILKFDNDSLHETTYNMLEPDYHGYNLHEKDFSDVRYASSEGYPLE